MPPKSSRNPAWRMRRNVRRRARNKARGRAGGLARRKGCLGAVAVAGGLLLVGGAVAAWSGGGGVRSRTATASPGLDGMIAEHAERAGLPEDLVRRVVRHESSFRPRAESPKGARGLMQIMPATHDECRRRFGLPDGDLFDPDYNLLVGTKYLAYLLDRFDGDVRLAVAAYHMGPTRTKGFVRDNPSLTSEQIVARYAGPATRAYVGKVLDGYEG